MFNEEAWQAIRFDLFQESMDYRGGTWEDDVLRPWLDINPEVTEALQTLGRPQAHKTPLADQDLWTLYALSRVTDLLIAAHQPAASSPDDEPFDSLPPATGYDTFIKSVGGRWPTAAAFHPFLHEIVEVLPAADPDEAPSLVKQWWPGFFVGSLLMVRAGVTVQAGINRLNPELSSRSPLYWAWTRRHRPTCDQSHGWGSNSQWRTEFRRDYSIDGLLHYNVDAALRQPAGGSPPEHADETVAIDLLRYRCSTTIDLGPDVWIWETSHTETAADEHIRRST